MFNFHQIVFQRTDKLKNNDHSSIVTYQLGKTIRNKILNDKEIVSFICVDEDVSFCLNTDQCGCADPHHDHIITGGLLIIKNNKSRKLLTMGPKYRESCTINFSKALIEITTTLDTSCIEDVTHKNK